MFSQRLSLSERREAIDNFLSSVAARSKVLQGCNQLKAGAIGVICSPGL